MSPRFLPRALAAAMLIGGALTGHFGPVDAVRPARAQSSGAVYLPDQYIVVFKDNVASPAQAAADLGRANEVAIDHVYSAALKGFAARVPSQQRLRQIANDPRVAYVERDQVVQAFDTLPTGVDRMDGDLSSTKAGDGSGAVNVDIAILDTGIQRNHPDLYVVGGKNCTSGSPTKWDDGHGHGTHVAGTAAAKDNGIGVVGAAPGARLWAVKVLNNNGSGTLSWIIAGVDYVTQNASTIEVANMSLGFQGSSSSLNTAIANSVTAGVTYAVAAGNSNMDAATFSPANHPDVICVSAVADSDGKGGGGGPSTSYGADDTLATFSNFGSVVDIAAPGVDILSTYKGSGYARMSGTSMASPHIAGAAALYKAANASATPADVLAALLATAKQQIDPVYGFTGDRDIYPEPLVWVGGF